MLEFDIPDESIVITANPSQIKQVFWNLARNSIQAMPSGGTLRVGLSRSGRNVKIIFEDTGKGIDPEYLEHVFEPFSDRASGTGLGLSIVHRIVTDHGGRIEIESILNEGTKVTVELPQQ
jgi:signal transduction histidine kinase